MPAKPAIYLDANASSPLDPRVRAELSALLDSKAAFLANPSSVHSHGREGRRRIEVARAAVAASLNVDSDRVTFVSSGTEANQAVIRSAVADMRRRQNQAPTWILSAVEHASCRDLVEPLRDEGVRVEVLPVDRAGIPDVATLKRLLDERRGSIALVSMIWVNNETGVVMPADTLSRHCRAAGAPLHLDAAQAWGKIPIDLTSLEAEYVTMSGHKIGALAGVGAIYSRGRLGRGLIVGQQERGARAGTENWLGIASLGIAATQLNPAAHEAELRVLRDELEALVMAKIPNVVVQGKQVERVAHTSQMSFPGARPDALVAALDGVGFSVSAGAACSSGALEPSRALLALGVSEADARATIRVSLPLGTTRGDIGAFVTALQGVVARLRRSIATPEESAEVLL